MNLQKEDLLTSTVASMTTFEELRNHKSRHPIVSQDSQLIIAESIFSSCSDAGLTGTSLSSCLVSAINATNEGDR